LEFGLFDHIEGMPGTPMNVLLEQRLELIRLADRAGFRAYHLAEHHGSDLCFAPNQEIFLAAAARETSAIHLGPLVKILPLHHPVGVAEDICLLDHLSGGRVEYGVGRGIAPIEHFWFETDWFASHERFDEALTLVLQGLHTGHIDPMGMRHHDFPPIDLPMRPFQQPAPPFWYPGNPVTAGRYGLNLMWPGIIPEDAYDLYVSTWHEHAGGSARADGPGSRPTVGTTALICVHEDGDEARSIAARGWAGLMRRVVQVHVPDATVLDAEQIEAARNPLSDLARAFQVPEVRDQLLPVLTATSGTPAEVRAWIEGVLATGRSEYVVLQVPTGDMTFEETRRSLELFVAEVLPAFR
jgi:alkanesulfonate monooxygenase SsuD/methylene tetrahydromethanopterin reductase-like flavin-dependent oxidoreductase (luciferase family)